MTWVILNSKKWVSDANVEHYWWSDILAWSSVATTACKLGTTNTFKKTCGLKIVFKEHCEIEFVSKLFTICMEKEKNKRNNSREVNILVGINKPDLILLSQRLWVRFSGPKNVPSCCTHLGPAQVMKVIIIDVQDFWHAHFWVITSN